MHSPLLGFAFEPQVWFQGWDPGQFIGLVSVIGGLLFVTICVIVSHWRGVRVAEIEASLKQQMLDKGMSAADIEKVLKASRNPEETAPTTSADVPKDLPSLVKILADGQYSGEDIERILRAVSADPLGRDVHGSDPAAHAVFLERAATVKNLVADEYSAEDIERVLRTYPQPAANAQAPTGAYAARG